MANEDDLAMISLHFLSLLSLVKTSQVPKRKHRFWVRKIFLEREKYGMHTLIRDLRNVDQEFYFDFMRMTPDVFDEILHTINPLIEKKNAFWRRSISADVRLALTLRFLATGETYRSLSFAFRIGRQTIQKIVPETCEAIWKCFKSQYLPFPKTPNDWKEIAENFNQEWQLPHCCGSIDGKHVLRECPKNSGSLNYNYKGTFSSVLLALADANYKFIMIDYGHYGSESDGGIFRKTLFGHMVINNELKFPPPDLLPNSKQSYPFFIIGDEAFPLRNNLLRPYPRQSNFHFEQKIFNYRLSRGRRVVENAFGILAARFRIFRRPLNYNDSAVKSMVLSSCVLHNLLIERSEAYCPIDYVDYEDSNHKVHMGLWRKDGDSVALKQLSSNMYEREGKKLRDEYKNYLCNEGSVPRQNKAVQPQNVP